MHDSDSLIFLCGRCCDSLKASAVLCGALQTPFTAHERWSPQTKAASASLITVFLIFVLPSSKPHFKSQSIYCIDPLFIVIM